MALGSILIDISKLGPSPLPIQINALILELALFPVLTCSNLSNFEGLKKLLQDKNLITSLFCLKLIIVLFYLHNKCLNPFMWLI